MPLEHTWRKILNFSGICWTLATGPRTLFLFSGPGTLDSGPYLVTEKLLKYVIMSAILFA